MGGPLILNSLEIQNFRAFRHLRVERLGLVNLITGKNNVGKSCLLEAVWLYARRGDPLLIVPLLEARDELSASFSDAVENAGTLVGSLKHLFYGRRGIHEYPEPIHIGPVGSQDDEVSIAIIWYSEVVGEGSQRVLHLLEPEEYREVEAQVPGIRIQRGKWKFSLPLDRPIAALSYVRLPPELKEIPCSFVAAGEVDQKQVGQWWNDIALTDLEDDVLDSLHIIAPHVERVSIMTSQDRPVKQVPIVRLSGLQEPIPLRSLGEGMNRLFGIALALVNARDGLLLVDEIDSGLHYSVQPTLWRLVFQVARRLNVQVFATTHSWDCIEGFKEAANEDKEAEGLLISLRVEKGQEGQVNAVLFDEHELEIVTRDKIEVR